MQHRRESLPEMVDFIFLHDKQVNVLACVCERNAFFSRAHVPQDGGGLSAFRSCQIDDPRVALMNEKCSRTGFKAHERAWRIIGVLRINANSGL